MGKLNNIIESSIAGLVDAAEMQKRQGWANEVLPSAGNDQPLKSGFGSFVFGQKENWKLLKIAVIGSIVQLIFFKLLYPFPDFISDSYSYIATNLYHMDVNLWPIGYSKYLSFIHSITPSDTFLVATQYILLQASLVYFFYTIIYHYDLSKKYTNILFVLLVFNPLMPYLANCVLSDALFCAMSVMLFSSYIWMLHKPEKKHIYVQALLIGVAFTFRYAAICYPMISIVVYLLSRQKLSLKMIGVAAPWFLIVPFILYTQQKTKEVTGTAEFSVFGGWQLANNALYMYDHITVDSNKLPPRTRELDRMARQFYKMVPPEKREFEPFPGTYFIKVPFAVLKPYMTKRYDASDAPSQFYAWGKVSPIYKEYGSYLIKHNPVEFAQYYLWLNAKNYFIPHLEKYGSYNMGMDSVWDNAKEWFNYPTNEITYTSASLQEHVFYFVPVIFMMLNLYFAGSFFYLLLSKRLKKINAPLRNALVLTTVTLFINFCFSTFATPVVLRYEIFAIILLVTFSLYLTQILDKTESADQ